MKKTFLRTVFVLLICIFSFSSCMLLETADNGGETPEISVDYAYQLAKDAGYSGSLEDFMEAIKGEDGAPGKDGTNGEDGAPGQDGAPGKDGADGKNGKDGKDGKDGADGKDGEDGRGIQNVKLDENGHLIITYTDGTTTDAGIITTEGVVVLPEEDESEKNVNSALLSSVSVWAEISSGLYSTGAGVIYSLDKTKGDAYVITNHHVVYESTISTSNGISNNIFLFLYGKEGYKEFKIPATYVGGSQDYDIAVLKVKNSAILKDSMAKAAVIGNSNDVAPYDKAIAIGNPLGDGISVTEGRVSVENESVKRTGYNLQSVDVYMMRIDTAVNEGNSGGGLFNHRGELIGIVSAKQVDLKIENIAYAIPSNLAISLADNIILNCDERGRTYARKPHLGISLKVYDAYAEYDEESGSLRKVEKLIVSAVEAGEPAYNRLYVNDKIVSIVSDGVEYDVERAHFGTEFTILVDVGSSLVINVIRSNGKEAAVTIPVYSSDFVDIK